MIDDKYLLLSGISKEFIKLDNINLYIILHWKIMKMMMSDLEYGLMGF